MSSATKSVVVDLFIADSSPLILLARIGKIDLLSALAGKVFIPETVLQELRAGSHRDGAASVVEKAPGLEVGPDLAIPAAVHAWDLDPGESQVLAHALTRPGSWAVLDDRAGRRCAASLGVATIGSLGTVLRARKVGLIPQARPLVEALRAQGLFLEAGIMNAALAEVGE